MDEELFITYGDKSNEELLFLYGEVLAYPCTMLSILMHAL